MSDLPQQDTIKQYTGDGITLPYTYTFLVPTINDIDVYITPAGQLANEDDDIQFLGVDYTVQNAGNVTGGTVTFLIAPALGAIVTLSGAVEASIDTNYVDPKTIIGLNLDNSFERVMKVCQQNQSKIEDRSLRFPTSSFLPDSSKNNVVPTLGAQQIWIGTPTGKVAAATLEEDPDSSTLRSELANEGENTDGANIVGYYDESRSLPTTVKDQLNSYGSAEQGDDGASLIGYYDETQDIQTNVATILRELENTLFPSGSYRWKSVPIVDAGYAACDGANYDMTGDATIPQIQRLGNLYNTTGLINAYGNGTESYNTTKPFDSILDHSCVSKGAAGSPDPHTSGFTITILVAGTPSLHQVVQVTTTAGSEIEAGAFYQIKAPSGRSAVFWFEVDGLGVAPPFPGELLKKVPILSSFTSNQVAQAILENSFLQYRVPKFDGLFPRAWNNGSGVDPDSALRKNADGVVIGDVVGSIQQDAFQNHEHGSPDSGGAYYDTNPNSAIHLAVGQNSPIGTSPYTGLVRPGYPLNSPPRISTESRGKNMYVYKLIKF